MCGAADGESVYGGSTAAQELQRYFLETCVEGLGRGYADAMRDFVASAVGAYEGGHTVESLTLCFELEGGKTGAEALDPWAMERPMADDEVALRTAWIDTVFLTCAEVNHPRTERPVFQHPPDRRMQRFVRNVVAAKFAGYDLTRLKLEQVLVDERGAAGMAGQAERAVLSQAMRIVFTTLDVLKVGKDS